MDPSKIQVIPNWPVPTTLTELHCKSERKVFLVENPTTSVLRVDESPIFFTSAHITRPTKTI